MMRLDDKDQDYTKEEIMTEMKVILPEEAYATHIENTNTLFRYVKLKIARH